jgi:hypothetical protein
MRSLDNLLSNMFHPDAQCQQVPDSVHCERDSRSIAMHRVVVIPRRPHRLSVSCAAVR